MRGDVWTAQPQTGEARGGPRERGEAARCTNECDPALPPPTPRSPLPTPRLPRTLLHVPVIVQHDRVQHVPRLDFRLVFRNDQESVGVHHGLEDAGPLGSC